MPLALTPIKPSLRPVLKGWPTVTPISLEPVPEEISWGRPSTYS